MERRNAPGDDVKPNPQTSRGVATQRKPQKHIRPTLQIIAEMLILHRTAFRRRPIIPKSLSKHATVPQQTRNFHYSPPQKNKDHDSTRKEDPRLGHILSNDFADIREKYDTPKFPIVLVHGLLGFSELHLAGPRFPGLKYWRGITEALTANGVEVLIAEVPPSSSIEVRAARLAEVIEQKANGRAVNIIAHSMGGLDSRYMISRLQPPNVSVLSLTTIATPHRGSAYADHVFDTLGTLTIARIYKALNHIGFETDAFLQLTTAYMRKFNTQTPDNAAVRYFSYGADLVPHFASVFRHSHAIMQRAEGANDGLVSVASARWGTYKGTLENVSHLDMINWTNRWRWYLMKLTYGHERSFNAVAFYLDIADMLAKEGL
ncbi:triacylglycerol lipase [Acrodontium crateriforme]|uniref:Triacylglycerol lipase n=1 Tax=Acrodontium crateriforme TaxID=150365 RepID=A0AAQ3MD62_9PEZI|nr:triacylglycerol lipase [Acrodontium crateriforme]